MRPLAALLLGVFLCTACAREDRGCVAAATPEAAAAGWKILEAGGNAADAAVAAAFALAVTEPAGSGLGGQSVAILMKPQQTPVVLDGSSFAPFGMPKLLDRDLVLNGRQAATVPSSVKTLHALWRDYGSGRVRWAECLAPAIAAAERGYRPHAFGSSAIASSREDLVRDSLAAAIFLNTAIVRQPLLAATLREIAEDPTSFYSGRIAREIARDMHDHRGWMTLDDLKRVSEPRVCQPLHLRYRDADIYTLPPPYGGWVVLEALNALQRGGKRSEVHPDTLIRALFRAHRERQLHPMLGKPVSDMQKRLSARAAVNPAAVEEQGGETTHLSVTDSDGMMVGISQSVNYYFGCKVLHPTLGFFYNDYMREFQRADSTHPFALRPGALPYSSMSATIVAREGRPEFVLGSPGSARIISAVVQVVHGIYDQRKGVGAAVAAPRFHVKPDSTVYFEDEVEAQEFNGRTFLPFRTVAPPADVIIAGRNPWFGGVHAVMNGENGSEGAADPRRDGAVEPAACWDR